MTNSPEQSPFDDIALHLETAAVTRELALLDEVIQAAGSHYPSVIKSMENAKMELLHDPEDYFTQQAERAKLTWQNHPALAKFLYVDDSTD